MSNKVLITNDQNVVKVPSGLRILIRRSCNAVLDFEHFDGPAEISVTFVDNNRAPGPPAAARSVSIYSTISTITEIESLLSVF